MSLTHIHTKLWLPLLQNRLTPLGNHKVVQDFTLADCPKEAERLALQDFDLTIKEWKQLNKRQHLPAKDYELKLQVGESYKTYFGGLNEVLALFYLLFHAGYYTIGGLQETSRDKYHRGNDLIGNCIYQGAVMHIQVKARKDPNHQFTESELFTFKNEAEKAAVLHAHRVLIVPTSARSQDDIMHWRCDPEYKRQLRFIGYKEMNNRIAHLPPIDGKTGKQIFWDAFALAVTEAVIVP